MNAPFNLEPLDQTIHRPVRNDRRTPAVSIIIGLNVLVFLAWQAAAYSPVCSQFMTENFLVSTTHIEHLHVWTLVTAAFSHNELWHLAINMFVLVELRDGPRAPLGDPGLCPRLPGGGGRGVGQPLRGVVIHHGEGRHPCPRRIGRDQWAAARLRPPFSAPPHPALRHRAGAGARRCSRLRRSRPLGSDRPGSWRRAADRSRRPPRRRSRRSTDLFSLPPRHLPDTGYSTITSSFRGGLADAR